MTPKLRKTTGYDYCENKLAMKDKV